MDAQDARRYTALLNTIRDDSSTAELAIKLLDKGADITICVRKYWPYMPVHMAVLKDPKYVKWL